MLLFVSDLRTRRVRKVRKKTKQKLQMPDYKTNKFSIRIG